MQVITHAFVSPIADSGDPNIVGPNAWNADHVLNLQALLAQLLPLLAWYPDVPAGAVNGVNTTYTLHNMPLNNTSVQFFVDGVAWVNSTGATFSGDFRVSGTTITIINGTPPATNSTIYAFYPGLPISYTEYVAEDGSTVYTDEAGNTLIQD